MFLCEFQHHYTVREVNITGSCFCNGHASVCNINATSGERSCSCQNNVCGVICDRCCPAYNQYPWKQGNGAPFEVDSAAACLRKFFLCSILGFEGWDIGLFDSMELHAIDTLRAIYLHIWDNIQGTMYQALAIKLMLLKNCCVGGTYAIPILGDIIIIDTYGVNHSA